MENQFTVSIWGDEGFSAILSMKPLSEIIQIIARDTSPPLYNLTEHFAFWLFGTSEVVIRGLSFFYYLLTIVFVYLIAKHVWNHKTAILASLATFLNPFFFIYAFEGRMYSILALGVTASMYFFIRRKWKLYIFATLWALYSHHFAIFAVFVQGLWFAKEFVFGERKIAKKMFKSFIFVGLFYLPWLYPLYLQTSKVAGGFWLGTPSTTDLKKLIYDYLAEGIEHKYASFSLYLTFATFVIRKWHKKINKTALLLLWFFVPILTTWLISQYFQSIFFNRYLLYTIPAAMIVLVSNRKKYLSITLIACTLFIWGIIDYNYFTNPTKPPFRELAAYVKSERKEGDFLINWNAGAHHLWETKYYDIPAPIYVSGDNELPFFVGTALMTENDIIREIPENAQRLGVVTSGSPEDIKIDNYQIQKVEEFDNLKIVWMLEK